MKKMLLAAGLVAGLVAGEARADSMWCYVSDYDVDRGPRVVVSSIFEGDWSQNRDYASQFWDWVDANYGLRHNVTSQCFYDDTYDDADYRRDDSINSWRNHDHDVITHPWSP